MSQPDRTTKKGRRDQTLLSLMYDTGARVQEIIDLTYYNDIRLDDQPIVILKGKGNKKRTAPIMKNTAIMLNRYIAEQVNTNGNVYTSKLLFCNHQRQKLSRKGVAYVLCKYVECARSNSSFIRHEKVTCHTLRHSRAAHMLQAGVPLIYIRDFLGHESIVSTEIYARLNDKIKRNAIQKAYMDLNVNEEINDWKEDKSLINWLTEFCK